MKKLEKKKKISWASTEIRKELRSASQRGGGEFAKSFSRYKTSLSKSNASYLLSNVLYFPLESKVVLPSIRGTDYAQIKFSTITPPCDISVELAWAIELVMRGRTLVEEHVNWLSSVDEVLNSGKIEEIKALLNKPEEKGNVSLFYLQLKICLLSMVYGLDSQKEFRNLVVANGAGTISAYLAHHASIRNEAATSASSMYQRLSKEISEYEDESLREYLSYKLFGVISKDSNKLSRVMQVESKTTVVDIYETLLDVLPIAFSYGLVDEPAIISAASRLGEAFPKDKRVTVLKGLLSGDLAREICSFNLGEGAEASWPGRVALDEQSFLSQLNECWGQYRGFADSYVDAGDALIKSELNLKGLSVAGRCGSSYYYALSGGYQGYFYGTLPSYGPQRKEDIPEFMAMPGRIGDEISRAYVDAYESEGFESANALKKIFAIFAYFRIGDVVAAKALLDDVMRSEEALPSRHELKILSALISIMLGRPYEAADLVAHAVSENEGYSFVMPLAKIYEGRDWSFYRDAPELENILVGLGAYCLINEDRDQIGLLRDLIDEYFLTVLDGMPSKTLEKMSVLSPKNRFIFSRILTPYLIDSSSIFNSENEVLEERIRICSLLESLDKRKSDVYKEEIKEITKGLKLGEAARHIDNSRIYVDEDALVRHVKKVVGDQFERFKALAASSGALREEIDEFWGAVKEALTQKGELPEKFHKIQGDEISNLLFQIVSLVKEEFLHHPEYGLDSHISMRIRHGTLAGTIRGVIAEAGIFFSETDDDSVRANPFVQYFFENFDEGVAWSAAHALLEFCQQVNARLDFIVSELMQIRGEGKADGLFDTFVSVIDFNSLKDYATRAFDIDEFIITCLVVFWQNLDGSLEKCREFFGKDLKEWFGDRLIGLQVKLVDIVGMTEAKNSGVIAAINSARTNMQVVLDRVSNWFKLRDIKAIDATYTAEQVVLVAQDAVGRCHPEVKLQVSISDSSGVGYVASTMGAMYDILFNILDNAASHSGLSCPVVDLAFSYESGYLRLDATNQIANPPTYEKIALIDGIRDRLYSQQYSEHIKKEGRSGMFKIGKYAPKMLPMPEGIGFEYVQGDGFHVFIKMEVIEFQREENESSSS